MKYFTIKELCYSGTALKLGIKNEPNEEIKLHLVELITKILDPLREAWGKPIRVTSGFRGETLNKAVKGSTTSAHCFGYAADLLPLTGNFDTFKSFVINWLKKNKIPFDLFIDEQSGSSVWCHIAIKNRSGVLRRLFLKYRNGKYYYLN